jgi:hypothetical protein
MTVTFGAGTAYTRHVVQPDPAFPGGWENATTWRGVFWVESDTGDGVNTIRVANARAADGFLIPDDTAHTFVIDTSGGGAANNGLAKALGTTAMYVSWSDEGKPAGALGFNIRRSASGTPGSYQKITAAAVAAVSYDDAPLQGGTTYFYIVDVVDANNNSTQWTPPFYGTTEGTPVPNESTLVVNVTPDSAPWSFLDSGSGYHSGTGDATVPNLPPGNATFTWGALANHIPPTPNPVTVTLVNGESRTVTGTYRQTGTVQVSVTPGTASWSFTDGDGGTHIGTGDATVTGIPTGTITFTWLALSGFTAPTPNPESKSLALGGAASFSGTYTLYVGPTGTVIVAVTPDTASWTFRDANSGIHNGTGDATLPGVPAGDVVMTWSALANHDAPVPSPVTQTLAPNGSTTFTGAYTRHKGTVQVSVTPDAASWSFTDGDGGAHNGTGDASMANIPTGTITLTWNALTGYRTPSVNPEGKALGKGGTVTFVGTYSSALSPARAGDWMLYE